LYYVSLFRIIKNCFFVKFGIAPFIKRLCSLVWLCLKRALTEVRLTNNTNKHTDMHILRSEHELRSVSIFLFPVPWTYSSGFTS